jgi:uncharacterized protein YbjT (DUF2867 family)
MEIPSMILGITTMPNLSEALSKLSRRYTPGHHEHPHPILILEGHGVVAYRVALRLLACGHPLVRIGVPDPSSMKELEQYGAQIVEFRWDRPETYGPALEDVKTLFCALPHHEKWDEEFPKFLDVAKEHHVKHFVKLSFYHTLDEDYVHSMQHDPLLQAPMVLMQKSCDTKLLEVSFPHTCILLASHFMSNPIVYQSSHLRKESKFFGASKHCPVNYVSPNDVAEVATRVLLAPHDHPKTYTLTNDKTITDDEIAQLLSVHLKKEVSYVDQELTQFLQTLPDTDWGPALDVGYLELAKASGKEESMMKSTDIEKVCGHAPETFEEYLNAQDLMTLQELEYLKP